MANADTLTLKELDGKLSGLSARLGVKQTELKRAQDSWDDFRASVLRQEVGALEQELSVLAYRKRQLTQSNQDRHVPSSYFSGSNF